MACTERLPAQQKDKGKEKKCLPKDTGASALLLSLVLTASVSIRRVLLAVRYAATQRLWNILRGEPDWLRADEVISINEAVVEATGEPFALLKPNELESACAKPINLWVYDGEERVSRLATSLVVGIARNHPFEQGNKRTGFVAGLAFLENNGYILAVDDDETFAQLIEDVITTKVSEEELSITIENNLMSDSTINGL